MALQSSGEIKISQINAELGRATNSTSSLDTLESGGYVAINTASPSYPSDARPASMSEWYSYDHSYSAYSNDYYYINDGVNDYIQGTWEGQTSLANNDWSISFWVKQMQSTAVSQQFWDFNANGTVGSGNTDNRVFLQYNASLNRFIARIRTNSTNFDRQWALHDNNSVTGTGTSSANKWTASNRGNVNSYGFTHIVVTYDASQTSAGNALKIYWNGAEMTTQAAANSGTRTNNTLGNLCLCGAQHNVTAGLANVHFDEWAFYNDLLTASEVSALYNSGTIVSPHTINTNNIQEVVQFTNVTTSINTQYGNYNGTITGGTVEAYV